MNNMFLYYILKYKYKPSRYVKVRVTSIVARGQGYQVLLFGDDVGQLHRPQQRRVAARLRRLHRLHHPTLQVRRDQPRRIRRRHGGVLAGGLGFYFSFSIPVTFPLSLAVWPATRIGFVWNEKGIPVDPAVVSSYLNPYFRCFCFTPILY